MLNVLGEDEETMREGYGYEQFVLCLMYSWANNSELREFRLFLVH